MKQDIENNRIIFNDDDDLCNYAVNKKYAIHTDDDGFQSFGWDFTDYFNDAIAANVEFVMNDLNSRILKNGLIEYNGITKPINIIPNYEKEIYEELEKELDAKEIKSNKRKK